MTSPFVPTVPLQMSDQSRRPAFFWLVFLLCGVYAGFCAVTIEASLRHYGTEKDPGWNVRADATGWIVSDVNASGSAARRIEPGNRLIALNGDGRVAVLFLLGHPSLYLTSWWLAGPPLFLYMVTCLPLTLVVTARNYQSIGDPGSRRRIRLVVAGLIVSLVPFIGLTLAYRVMGWMEMSTFQIYNPLAFIAMLAIPASIATAVWKEQLFDIRVLVRRGLQYLFARSGAPHASRASDCVAGALDLLESQPHRRSDAHSGLGLAEHRLIGAIAAALHWRRRLQTWLDRRFFREDYQQEQVLVHLIDEVRQRESLAEIAQLVSARIDSVLHPTSLHIFYREKGDSDFISGRSLPARSEQNRLGSKRSRGDEARLAASVTAADAAAHTRRREGDPRFSIRLRRLAGRRALLAGEPGCPTDRADHRNWLPAGWGAAAGRPDVGRAVFRNRQALA